MNHFAIPSFNPFEGRYPGYKVISWETLELVKEMRSKGMDVSILPENNKPLCYTFKKGDGGLFSDPIIIFGLTSVWSVLINIVSNRIDHRIQNKKDRKKTLKRAKENIIIVKDESSNEFYSLEGKRIERLKKQKIEEKRINTMVDYNLSITASPPKMNLRHPIYLEHAYNRIVGWGNVKLSDSRLILKEYIFTLESIPEKIRNGEIKGMSVAGIAVSSSCSICNSNYVNCNHISGRVYDGKECINSITKSLLADVSLVKDPINQNCIIEILREN